MAKKIKLVGPGFCFLDGVPAATQELLEAATPIICQTVRFEHFVTIVVCPAPVVSDDGFAYGFGAFNKSRRQPEIWMGGDYSTLIEQGMMKPSEAGCCFISTLLHELAHYEQARDKKKVQEKGVAVRTRTLCRIFLGQLALLMNESLPNFYLPHFDCKAFCKEIDYPVTIDSLRQRGFKTRNRLNIEATVIPEPEASNLKIEFVLGDATPGGTNATSLHESGGVSETDSGVAGPHADRAAGV